jgi:hypothetical protein
MTYTYEQLSKFTVAQLREIAQGVQHDAVKGFSTMHKDKLLPVLCYALGIDARAHHQVVGVNKSKIKSEIRELKVKRAAAIANRDKAELKAIRDRIHRLKHILRRAIIKI